MKESVLVTKSKSFTNGLTVRKWLSTQSYANKFS